MYKKLKLILKISIAIFFLIIIGKLIFDYIEIDLSHYTKTEEYTLFNREEVVAKMKGNYKILDVANFNQANGYPAGCESASTVMILNYWGYNITVADFIDEYLDKEDLSKSGGTFIGPSPNDCFIGDPTKDTGYGCFAPVIINALQKFIPNNYSITNLQGESFEHITRQYIDKDIPVLMWLTIDMKPVSEGTSWKLRDSGEIFTWPAGEHCLVMVGYDEQSYYFNDPYNGNGLVHFDKAVVEQRYKELGEQALAIYSN